MKTFQIEPQHSNKKQTNKKIFLSTLFTLGLFLLLLAAIFFPLAAIWSLNVLFSLNIAYSFWNWLAMVVLIMTLQASLKIGSQPLNVQTKRTENFVGKTEQRSRRSSKGDSANPRRRG